MVSWSKGNWTKIVKKGISEIEKQPSRGILARCFVNICYAM